jgi:hypothetical protein
MIFSFKLKAMLVVSTKEFKEGQKKYLDLAEEEKIVVKNGNKYVNLIITEKPDTKFVSEKWIDDFFSVPAEYRCNPFEVSPSGDLFWADKRNIEQAEKGFEDIEAGRVTHIANDAELDKFLDSL